MEGCEEEEEVEERKERDRRKIGEHKGGEREDTVRETQKKRK